MYFATIKCRYVANEFVAFQTTLHRTLTLLTLPVHSLHTRDRESDAPSDLQFHRQTHGKIAFFCRSCLIFIQLICCELIHICPEFLGVIFIRWD